MKRKKKQLGRWRATISSHLPNHPGLRLGDGASTFEGVQTYGFAKIYKKASHEIEKKLEPLDLPIDLPIITWNNFLFEPQ